MEKVKVSGRIWAAAVLLSGCDDQEYSYDALFNGRPNGAFTYTALQTLRKLPGTATYRDWHREIRKILPNVNYPQTPQTLRFLAAADQMGCSRRVRYPTTDFVGGFL